MYFCDVVVGCVVVLILEFGIDCVVDCDWWLCDGVVCCVVEGGCKSG